MSTYRPEIRRIVDPKIWRSQITKLQSLLRDVGIEIPPGSRIRAFEAANEAFIAEEITTASLDDTRLHALLSGARDVSELYGAAELLLPSADKELLHRFRVALGGYVLPSDINRLARTAQFELYTASMLCRAGMAVAFAEPDLVALWRGVELAVACKRIESARQYRKRLKEGTEQVERSGLRGIVAVSFDYIRSEHYPGFVDTAISNVSRIAPRILESIVDPLELTTWNVVHGKPVLALLASVVIPAVIPGENAIGRVASALMRIIEANCYEGERQFLIEIVDRLARPPQF
jgi:hypothetical protein